MKKSTLIFIVICLMMFILCDVTSCDNNGTYKSNEEKGDAYFYDTAKGAVYTDLSEKFDFKIEKWGYYFDKEANRNRILLSIAIKNKTEVRIDNFLAIISFDDNASNILASGITRYDKNEPYDLIPVTTANGASYALDLLVEKDEWLNKENADKNDLLQKIRNITLELYWDGGEETIQIVCDNIKKIDN
jgi:predicted RNA-binding protein (virulence factor B family)